MEFINKDELLKALEKKFGDLSDISGAYSHTDHGFEWLSVAAIVELIESLDTYE